MNAAARQPPGYGGFTLGGMQLALPFAALREVVPRGNLLPLPCPARCVIGGLDLRGVLLPVVDLRLLLGRDAPLAARPSVIVMVHDGRLLGLLADDVTDLFPCVEADFHRMAVADPTAAILAGSFRRADGVLVNVLAPDALAALPQVPMADDPAPRQRGPLGATTVVRPTMLLRCGRMAFALDAMAVHMTLARPVLETSPLARGHCRGVIAHDGARIPALDLLDWCGLGQLDPAVPPQAFLVRYESGLLAFLVGAVVDVLPLPPDAVVPVPAFALPRRGLFSGALPVAALPDGKAALAGDGNQFLVIDGAALRLHADLAALAGLGTRASDGAIGSPGAPQARFGNSQARDFVPAAARHAGRRSMLTYELDGEVATPVEQLREILTYAPARSVLDDHGPLLGIVVDRGRSIPLLSLARLLQLPAPAPDADARVLVVDAGGDLLGFVVPALRSIEPADWEPELPAPGGRAAGGLDGVVQSRKLAQMGAGASRRMLRVVDLARLAAVLREERA